MEYSIITAVANNNVIGNNNDLPWYLPSDLKYFERITKDHCVIMGRKTAIALGEPLKDRINIALTSTPIEVPHGFLTALNISDAFKIAQVYAEKSVFIIGGQSVYEQTMDMVEKLYITEIYQDFKGDTFFPEIDITEWKCIKENNVAQNKKDPNSLPHCFKVFERI